MEVRLGTHLEIDDIDAASRGAATVVVPRDARRRVERAHSFVLDLTRVGTPVYGLTTGCGPLSGNEISPEGREAFQRNLVRSHACGLGRPHATELVRAAMVLRAHVFARGCSGVDPELPELLCAMFARGIHPIVREIGGVGASGDLVELAQVALAVIGEGDVEADGQVRPAAEVLVEAGLSPIAPRLREGLALMNGTSFHTGAAALLAARARRLRAAAEVAAALAFEALGGHVEALDPALHAARPQPGQQAVAWRMRSLVEGGTLVRRDDSAAARQAAQVMENAERMVAIEMLCAAQALDLRGSAGAGAGTRAAHALVRQRVAPLVEDRLLTTDVDAVRDLIVAGAFV